MVIGFHSRSNAAKQITNFKEFTVNVPSENLMNEIEIGGFFHKVDKIPLSKLEYEIESLLMHHYLPLVLFLLNVRLKILLCMEKLQM